MIWLNGALRDGAAARIDPSDRGLTLGDGLFETIRAENGIPCHLDRHLARLHEGAAFLGIPVPFKDDAIADACRAMLAACALRKAALRLTLTRGPGLRGVLPPAEPSPTLLLTAGPLPLPLPPARLVICRTTRRNEHSPLARIKSLNYLDGIIARREAAERGADDAILLNTAGRVAETSVANLFVSIEGVWVTPPVADGALPGIARALMLESAFGVEHSLTEEDLGSVQAGLLCNSLSRRVVASIDGRPLDRTLAQASSD